MPERQTTSDAAYPTLGYLTRRQPPGSGIPPGSEWSGEAELAVAG